MARGIKLPQDRLLHAERVAGCMPKLEQAGAITKPAELRQGGEVEAPFARAIVRSVCKFACNQAAESGF